MIKQIFSSNGPSKAVSSFFCDKRAHMSQLSAKYNPDSEVEIRTRWKQFSEDVRNEQTPKFSMILPPPNITGNLHLGHALTITIQDVIARWKQMCSNQVCWVPGFDHAGIATQSIVEKYLYARKGLTRQQMGKETLLKEIWYWRNEKKVKSTEQIRSLGPILDWTREFFTLDEEQRQSVTNALIRLWEQELIYRKSTLVNWCCHLKSVLSDIEVSHVNLSGPTSLQLPSQKVPVVFGRIMKIAYPVLGKEAEIEVATTRPETIFGDVAIAVHPSDSRYHHFHGAHILHPLTGKLIPLILDTDVDPNFGTGALKITPAHAQLDYEIGKRHNLPMTQVIDEDGNLNSQCGLYTGLNRWVAREMILDDLAKRNLLRSVDPHSMQVPICSRSGDVIELILKAQWFIKCEQMAKKASSMVRTGQLVLEPDKYNNVWFDWMENIKDWCISRQVWWGHEIPFYQCFHENNSSWVCAKNEEEALLKGQNLFKSTEVSVVKDNDVLDTWFSSALLPFTAHGWPLTRNAPSFQDHYPLSLMVTGNDILFFWVARMVMLGIQLTDQLPFKKVLLHGIICDNLGRKMSKSKGNVIDPINIIHGCTLQVLKDQVVTSHKNGVIDEKELQTAISGINEMFPDGIPKCGADALRFTLLSQRVKSTYVNFNIKECYVNKLFCNKLWQATKFSLLWAKKYKINTENYLELSENLTVMEKWIVNRLSVMADTLNNALKTNEFHLATSSLKSFLHSDLCSVYIEYIKPILKSENELKAKQCCETLLFCLEISFRSLAPFMPHLTDELYRKLPGKDDITVAHCVLPSDLQLQDLDLDRKVKHILGIIENIRRIRSDLGIHNKDSVSAYLVTDKPVILNEFIEPLRILSGCLEVNVVDNKYLFDSKGKYLREVIDDVTDLCVQLKQDTNLVLKPTKHKTSKLQRELDKLLKMRLHKGYENVSQDIQTVHSTKIMKLQKKLKELA